MIAARIALIRADLTLEIPPGPDRLLDRVDGRVAHGLPAAEALAQREERDVAVAIVGRLREDRQDQLVERPMVRLRPRDTVERTQRIPDLPHSTATRRSPRSVDAGGPRVHGSGRYPRAGVTTRRTRRCAPTLHRNAPTLLAGALALAYVIVSPPSPDLADALLRARLFGAAPFGLWNNWWYAGHATAGYSVLFGPLAWALTPQLAAAFATTASAAVFAALARAHFGERAQLGSLWFALATVTILMSGRLTFALGMAPALGTALALARRRPATAALLAVVTALISPVAALFAALAGAATALGAPSRRNLLAGGGVVVGALTPVLLIALAFGGSGREPFAVSAFWPIPILAIILWAALGPGERILRAGVVLYAAGCTVAFLLPTAVGGNAARLAALVAGPLLVMAWRPARPLVLALALSPLFYLQWQAAIRDVAGAARDPSTSTAYYQPLLAFLERQPGPPFRIEIPFTANHWEAYEVAPQVALARGWERQLDIENNGLFYSGTLTAARYERWLDDLAVRFVALPDVALDDSARQEARLIEHGTAFLRPVLRTDHWRVYAVTHPTAIVTGAATLRALGPDSVTLSSTGAGRALVRVRYSPYWTLAGRAAAGACVAPAGGFTSITLRHPGPVALVMAFTPARINAHSPRCHP